ncbi:MAG TPA: choice-of-anchor E domain-containing protein [Tepidisphaeraceae bacterium]|jgi:hypothetical protein
MHQSRCARVALSLGSFIAFASCGSASAAVIAVPIQTFTVTVTAPASTVNTSFTVPGFNAALGTLNAVTVRLGDTMDPGGASYTFRNNTASPFTGTYTESVSVSLRRADTDASIRSVTGSSQSFQFTTQPGAASTFSFSGFGGEGSGDISSANRAYFSSNNPIALTLRTTGITLSNFGPLTLESQSGTSTGSAFADIHYIYQPPASSGPLIAISSTTTATLGERSVDWYQFDYAGGALTIDTLGTRLFDEFGFEQDDTEMALYSSTGARLQQNDDIDTAGGNFLSRLSFTNGSLAPGRYFLAVGAFNSTFNATNFGASSSSGLTGTYQVNLNGTPVPEPTTAMLATALLAAVCRRRRAC